MSHRIGDRIEVVFESARGREGCVSTERINGRIAFAEYVNDTSLSGDTWLCEIAGENPRKTVYFLQPIHLVKAGDGLDELLVGQPQYVVTSIRKAHKELMDVLQSAPQGEVGAKALVRVASEQELAPEYRFNVATLARRLLEKQCGREDTRFIPIVTILAYSSKSHKPEETEELFKWLVELLDRQEPDPKRSTDPIVGALANLGKLYFEQARWTEAEAVYRRANEVGDDLYVTSQLACCLFELGRHEEAFQKIRCFAEFYFDARMSEWSEHRTECEDEYFIVNRGLF